MQFNLSYYASHILKQVLCYLELLKKPRLSKTKLQLLLQLVESSIWLKAPIIKRRTRQSGSNNLKLNHNSHETLSVN